MHTDTSTASEEYLRLSRRRLNIIIMLCIALILAASASLMTGSYNLSFIRILESISGTGSDSMVNHLVWSIRLPRMVAALLAGASLGLSGCIMQALLKNRLASPSTLGISQGAAFGAACSIILLGTGVTFNTGNEAVLLNSYGTTALCAFGGSLVTVAAIVMIAASRQISSESMVLAGVAMGAFLSACTMLLQYFATDLQVAATLFWTFGDLGKAGWLENRILAILFIPAFIYLLAKGWSLNALRFGDDVARSMGVATTSLRFSGLLLTCLIVSATTAFLGIIAFIGLMAPHIMRPFTGSDHRYLIPASSLCGALLLLSADCLSRTLFAPVIIPVGIITSFAGAPLFLWLLLKRWEV